MSERQQSDDRAARLLLAVTGQQCFEGALIGAAREELLTIEPRLSNAIGLRRKRMDDRADNRHMTVFAAGMRSPAAQRDQRRRAEETFEPIVPRVRLDRPEDRLPAAREADGRSGARAPN